MFEGDQELIADFVVESREGLAEIETDILRIEECGSELDTELVNKVFRAIHSIKGASGFIGLHQIGELSHAFENVLCLLRNGELVPDPASTDLFLRSADLLKQMIDDAENSNDTDVGDLVRSLTSLAEGGETVTATTGDSEKPALSETDCSDRCGSLTSATETAIIPKSAAFPFSVSNEDIRDHDSRGHHLYAMTIDLIGGLKEHARTPLELIQRLGDTGEIVKSCLDFDEAGELTTPEPDMLNLFVLFSTPLDPDVMATFWNLPPERLVPVTAESPDSNSTNAVQESAKPVEVAAPNAQTPNPVSQDEKQVQPKSETTEFVPEVKSQESKTQSVEPQAPAPVDSNIRVAVSVLDRLMNLAGELVLARNQLLQTISTKDMRGLESVGARLDQVTSEVQESIMQTRMQPIGNVFKKFERVVRDLSRKLDKQCDLVLEGKAVELDKTIIEAVSEPFTHLVRNSVDHGIEAPAIRVERGKVPTGTIRLRAFHQEGKVNIHIEDDGGGIDLQKLRDKAVKNKLLTVEQAKSMSDGEAARLIFHPGLSTAEQVSDVSGRGVGMDVVRTNLERIGGSVEVETELSVGTKIKIKLPLTLAIIPSLVVRCGEDRFAVPQVNISELVRIKAEDTRERIQRVNGAEVLRLRGNLLPLIRLEDALASRSGNRSSSGLSDDHFQQNMLTKRASSNIDLEEAAGAGSTELAIRAEGAMNILVVEAGHFRYGIVVDGLHDSEEIVVKPLGRHMSDCRCLAGATVLGDGWVALILDIAGIATHTQLQFLNENREDLRKAGGQFNHAEGQETFTVLLITNHPEEQFGIPMSTVERVERIRSDQIDEVGGQKSLQYRGGSLPLLNLDECITAQPCTEQDSLHVIVFDFGNHEVGADRSRSPRHLRVVNRH